MKWHKPKAAATFIIGACAIAALLDQILEVPFAEGPPAEDFRRSLQLSEKDDNAATAGSDWMQSWAKKNVHPLRVTPDPSKETIVLWHIPKSGGSTAKAIYRCLGKKIDIESQPLQILKAKELGLVSSGKAEVIFSSFPEYAVKHLFDNTNKARMLAMFREPIDRLISKFYYLQVARWESTYRPEWKGMDMVEWAQNHNMDNNHMVKKLVGKVQRDPVTEQDLNLAKETLKNRVIVGLISEMEESIHRFNIVIGIDEEDDSENRKCMKSFFAAGVKGQNSNPHPKIEKDDPVYKLLAKQNELDLKLYDFIVKLFKDQKDIVDSYKIDMDRRKVTAFVDTVE